MKRSYLLISLCAAMALSATALAQPSLQFVDNGDSSVTLQVVVDATGSTASELLVTDAGLLGTGNIAFTDVYIADPAVFDTANPGNNPITGTVTNGLYLDDLATNEVFASFGSTIVGPGSYDFLTVEYAGYGTIDAIGLLAQLGVVHSVTASIDVDAIPEPSTAVLLVVGSIAVWAFRRT
jgi:hypothetical protein